MQKIVTLRRYEHRSVHKPVLRAVNISLGSSSGSAEPKIRITVPVSSSYTKIIVAFDFLKFFSLFRLQL